MNQQYPPDQQQQQAYAQQQQQAYAQQQQQQAYAQQQQAYAQQQQQGAHNPTALQALGPKGQKLLQSVTLLPSESIQYAIMADGYFLGANPIQKVIASVMAALTTITGGHIRIFLIVTNQRILLLQSQQQWCGFNQIKGVNAIALASLAEAGSGKETRCCFVHSRLVHIETKTQRHQFVIKKLGDAELQGFVANLSAVLIANVQSRTAT